MLMYLPFRLGVVGGGEWVFVVAGSVARSSSVVMFWLGNNQADLPARADGIFCLCFLSRKI